MKKLTILLSIFLIACNDSQQVNDLNAWINTHEKPIVVNWTAGTIFGDNVYTLIDANSEIYVTGLIELNLPDTLH